MAFNSMQMNGLYEPHGEVPTKIWLLLPLRLYVGIYFIILAIGKVAQGYFANPEVLIGFLRRSIEAPDYPYAFYRGFFHAVIIPYPWLFAFLIVFGELLVGLALITGTLTRLACLAGLLMMVNFNLAVNVSWEGPHNTTSFAAILLVLFLTGAGRAYGMDHYLRGKVPLWMA